jgi:hypothetical protein
MTTNLEKRITRLEREVRIWKFFGLLGILVLCIGASELHRLAEFEKITLRSLDGRLTSELSALGITFGETGKEPVLRIQLDQIGDDKIRLSPSIHLKDYAGSEIKITDKLSIQTTDRAYPGVTVRGPGGQSNLYAHQLEVPRGRFGSDETGVRLWLLDKNRVIASLHSSSEPGKPAGELSIRDHTPGATSCSIRPSGLVLHENVLKNPVQQKN